MPDDLSRQLRKAMDQAVGGAMKEVRKNTQATFDRLSRSHKGKPVPEVKRALKRAWEREPGAKITDPELTAYATAISEGTRIKVR